MSSTPNFVCVTGLPRAGSTLLCQLLAQHPEVHCEGQSSPLCNVLLGLRKSVSEESFFLSQLDSSFERAYGHLQSAMQAFLRHWYHQCERPVVVDKNRTWLQVVEFLLTLAPEAKLVVCLRDLSQIYASVENQHQRTILLDFVDNLADLDRFGRADALFHKSKTLGAALHGLHAVADLPPLVQQRLYFLRFEDLTQDPKQAMDQLFQWLGVGACDIDLEHLHTTLGESDSHYHMKYLHRQSTRFTAPSLHELAPRIRDQIERAYDWYYQRYYPGRR